MAKKKRPTEPELSFELDDSRLLDPDYFYWQVLRPAEEEAEARRERRRQRKERQRVRLAQQSNALLPVAPAEEPPDGVELVKIIDGMIRTTHHANGYRHLGEIGQMLRAKYPNLDWAVYGCKKLLEFLEKYPEVFRIKQSAPAHRGKSSAWVRLVYEPKRKEGYSGE